MLMTNLPEKDMTENNKLINIQNDLIELSTFIHVNAVRYTPCHKILLVDTFSLVGKPNHVLAC